MPSPSPKPLRLAILISGRGSNMECVLETIRRDSLPVEVCVVLSDKADAEGLQRAAARGIPTQIISRRAKDISREEYDVQLTAAVQAYSPDLVLLAGFMRVVGSVFIRTFPQRIINIHPSLLPSFRGLHAQKQALAAGVKFAGCTVHIVVEDVDAGPILAQAVVPVLPGDSEETLSARILCQEHRILPAVIAAIAHGKLSLDRIPDRTHSLPVAVSLSDKDCLTSIV